MTRKNKQHFLLLTVLSVGHLLFSTTGYPFLFAYFNSHDYAALCDSAGNPTGSFSALDRSLGLFSAQRTPSVFLALSRIVFH